jgi:hypothetical protein
MNQKRIWLVEIDGEWWIKFKKLMGRWTKNKALATPVTTAEARIYRKDWASYGVRIHRAAR